MSYATVPSDCCREQGEVKNANMSLLWKAVVQKRGEGGGKAQSQGLKWTCSVLEHRVNSVPVHHLCLDHFAHSTIISETEKI